MREAWRWFGEFDPIALKEVAQTGAKGIVSALHAIPYGEVWHKEHIRARKREIEAAGFTWDVVESLPVHEHIKRGQGHLDEFFSNYRQSLSNLAAEGVTTVCYNFMPVLDWTRTDLDFPLSNGGTCLRFSASKMAAFEVFVLGREAALNEYSNSAIEAGKAWYEASSEEDHLELLCAIMSGLPGAVDTYDLNGLRTVIETYEGIGETELRENLRRFLGEVIPAADDLGILMCIHPDDPPRNIFGLPRIVSTEDALQWILSAQPSTSNGITLCTGSLGSNKSNDLPAIAKRHANRVHFAHLRNVVRDADGSFEESGHLFGDVDMLGVIEELLLEEARRGFDIPFRADHGHALLSDREIETQPGYSLIGRLQGLSELRGAIHATRALAGGAT